MGRPDWIADAAREIATLFRGILRPDDIKQIEAIIEEHYLSESLDEWISKAALGAYCISIDCHPVENGLPKSLPTIWRRYAEKKIELIAINIEKHCPEEFSQGLWAKMCVTQQAAEKVAGTLIEARVKLGFPLGKQPRGMINHLDWKVADTVKIIDSALAEYERVHNKNEARFRRNGESPERGLPSGRAYTGASGNQVDSDVPPDTSEPPSEALHTPDSSGEPPQSDLTDTDEPGITKRSNQCY